MSWSARKRLIYGIGAVLIVALISLGIFYKVFYNAPTCTDGFKNGDEKGVDCGGSCRNLCTSDALKPIVFWTKIFNISGDVYTVVSYLENPNITSTNSSVKYQFKIYDENNKIVLTKEGVTSIPKGKKFAIFENNLYLKGVQPKTAELEFLSFGPWIKDTSVEPKLNIKYSTLTSTSTVPRITGTITNDTLDNVGQVELSVFVLDGNENVVAAGRTYVDNLLKRTVQDFVFTWPKPFNLGVESCLAPLDIVLALDKSGSMRSEGLFPPEPFTTVIKTAKNFIKNLKSNDQVGVVSFGNNPKTESTLSANKEVSLFAVDSLFLSTTTIENTNITGGLSSGFEELESALARADSKKAIILLTDGLPTLPVDPNNIDFPSTSAQDIAKIIKDSGVDIYTIGLGKNVSEGFLKSISKDDSHYFNAPTKETLNDIYSRISSRLCEKKPNVINVIYKIIK